MNSSTSPHNASVVILAAGRGTRMKSDIPKVATPLLGKPLLQHVIENLYQAGLRRYCIVVGYKRELVQSIVPHLSDCQIDFVEQKEQLGTAHAFACAESALEGYTGSVMVASGDMPALSPTSFRSLLEFHQQHQNQATVLSAQLDDPASYGRIVRDEQNQLQAIVEYKDASDDIRQIREVNTGTYVFEAPRVFEDLRKIGSNNAQNEYYLPDIISLYRGQGLSCDAQQLEDARQALGVNSKEELERLSVLLQK